MVSPRAIALTKMLIDLTFIVCVFAVYFTDTFRYMDKYYIGVYKIVVKEKYLTSDLYKEISVLYSEFDFLCSGELSVEVNEICKHREAFENAGILYFTFSALGNILVIYSILGMFGIFCKCASLGVVEVAVVHYIYPGLYISSVIMYLSTSNIFVLTSPDSTYKVDMQAGMILMWIALCLSLCSMFFFIFSQKYLKSDLKKKIRVKPALKRRNFPSN